MHRQHDYRDPGQKGNMFGAHVIRKYFEFLKTQKATHHLTSSVKGSFHSPNVERDWNSQANIFLDAFLQLSNQPLSEMTTNTIWEEHKTDRKKMTLFTAIEGPTLITRVWFNIKRQQNYIISIYSKCSRDRERKKQSIEYLC